MCLFSGTGTSPDPRSEKNLKFNSLRVARNPLEGRSLSALDLQSQDNLGRLENVPPNS